MISESTRTISAIPEWGRVNVWVAAMYFMWSLFSQKRNKVSGIKILTTLFRNVRKSRI